MRTTAALAATGLLVGAAGAAVSQRRRPTPHLGLELGDPLLRPPRPAPEVRSVASADGTVLHVQLHGPANAPALVLSHGWTCSTRYWNPWCTPWPPTTGSSPTTSAGTAAAGPRAG